MTEPTIVVTGNLTRDPELRFTPAGKPLVKFAVAHTPRAKNPETGRWEDSGETQFHDIVAWSKLAENAAESLLKGDAVIVIGRSQTREYTAHDGTRRTATEIVADDIGPSVRRNPAQPSRAVRRKPLEPEPSQWAPSEMPPF